MTVELATAIVLLLTAVLGFSRVFRKIEQIHVIVNSRMTAVLERVEQLTAALEGSDTDVPPDPNA